MADASPANEGLEPIDLERCQTDVPNPDWSPFRLGPVPKIVRCPRSATKVVMENEPNPKDGKRGAMSMCDQCFGVFENTHDVTRFAVAKVSEVFINTTKSGGTDHALPIRD